MKARISKAKIKLDEVIEMQKNTTTQRKRIVVISSSGAIKGEDKENKPKPANLKINKQNIRIVPASTA